jgi:S1-C subfamily serine protease
MKRELTLGVLFILMTILLSGCFGIYTVPPSAQGEQHEVKGTGLGANAPTKIWTDGTANGRQIDLKSDTYIELAKKVNPAVVNIFTSQKLESGIGVGLFAIPLPNMDMRAQSLGTGFIISEDGFMLTNYHVIQHADEIQVYLHETSEVQPIKVVGVDPLTDIAVLKIQTNKKLPFLPLADSGKVEIGEQVLAVGNPFGLTHSLTTGVVSAKNRTLSPGTRRGNFEQYLQTSAQINPGNSGGPLLNLHGEVIGINTAIIKQAQGIGFAVPSNLVKELAPAMVRTGEVTRGYFGIAVLDLTPVLAQRYKVTEEQGVFLARMDTEGPAAQAGLARGDIILTLDGKKVESSLDCARRISQFAPGTRVRVEVLRGGQIETFTVVTDEY